MTPAELAVYIHTLYQLQTLAAVICTAIVTVVVMWVVCGK